MVADHPGAARARQIAAQRIEALEALARLAEASPASPVSPDPGELASAKERLLAARVVADVRPVGPARRGRTLAVHVQVLRSADGAPRAGAIHWLEQAVERLDVALVGAGPDGSDLHWRVWLRASGLSARASQRVRFPKHKPPADVYVDPRAFRFEGTFPDMALVRAMMIPRQ